MNYLTNLYRRITDINPVTLKELRQLVRSRFILWAMFLYPILLLIISCCTLSSELAEVTRSSGPNEAALARLMVTAGPALLRGTLLPLGGLVAFLIPAFTGVRLVNETGRERMDLQFTTALTTENIVDGKLMGSFILALTFTALSLPFLTLAYLMRGIDLATIAWATLGVVAMSVAATTLAVTAASLRMPVGVRKIALGVGGLVLGGYFFIGAILAMISPYSFARMTSSELTILKLGLFAGAVATVALGRTWAASNLKAEHTDFKHGLRWAELVLVVLSWIVTLVGASCTGDDEWTAVSGTVFFFLIAVGVVALFVPSGVMRVVAARAPKSFIGRCLAFPLATTAASGALFAFLLALGSLVCTLLGLEAAGTYADRDDFLRVGVTIFGGVMLIALPVALIFRVQNVRRRFYSRGPLIVLVIFCVLQGLGGLLNGVCVVIPCCLRAIIEMDADARVLQYVYAGLGLCLFAGYLVSDVFRTFRRYRRAIPLTRSGKDDAR